MRFVFATERCTVGLLHIIFLSDSLTSSPAWSRNWNSQLHWTGLSIVPGLCCSQYLKALVDIRWLGILVAYQAGSNKSSLLSDFVSMFVTTISECYSDRGKSNVRWMNIIVEVVLQPVILLSKPNMPQQSKAVWVCGVFRGWSPFVVCNISRLAFHFSADKHNQA